MLGQTVGLFKST